MKDSVDVAGAVGFALGGLAVWLTLIAREIAITIIARRRARKIEYAWQDRQQRDAALIARARKNYEKEMQ